jgi:BioD-like phosphotransacetylase family protein
MHFSEISGLKLMGAFPKIPVKSDNKINYPLIASRSVDQIAQRIRLEDLRLKNRSDQPFALFFISTRENEGKTYLATRIVEKLRASGSKVLYVKPVDKNSNEDIKRRFTSFDQPEQAWDYEYSIPDNFISTHNINELLRNYTFLTKGYQFIAIELPALLIQEYPANLTESGHLSILIGRATRTWNKADEEAVKLYQSSINHTVLALLNGCQVDQLEAIIGEIPKRRSLIRKLVKKIVNLDLKTLELV